MEMLANACLAPPGFGGDKRRARCCPPLWQRARYFSGEFVSVDKLSELCNQQRAGKLLGLISLRRDNSAYVTDRIALSGPG